MSEHQHTVEEILDRLQRFEARLELDGAYVDANIVHLAIQALKKTEKA
jgi:hypothetical protein